MCGIIGYNGNENSIPLVLEGIKNLEYRGYDSFGCAFEGKNKNIEVRKDAGRKIVVIVAVLISIGLIIWVLITANLGFVGLSSKSVSQDLYTYAPYIVVFLALIIGAYFLFK